MFRNSKFKNVRKRLENIRHIWRILKGISDFPRWLEKPIKLLQHTWNLLKKIWIFLWEGLKKILWGLRRSNGFWRFGTA